MSLATICASLAVRVGVQATAPWLNSPDPGAAEVAEFAQDALAQVAGEFDWRVLLRDLSLPLTGAREETLTLPANLSRLVPDALWIGTTAVTGPLDPATWETARRSVTTTACPIYQQSGDVLLVRAGSRTGTLTGRYVCNERVAGGKATFTGDGDASVLDERLILLCAVALYRDSKGLPAGASAAQYPAELAKARARDQPRGILSLGGTMRDRSNPLADAAGRIIA